MLGGDTGRRQQQLLPLRCVMGRMHMLRTVLTGRGVVDYMYGLGPWVAPGDHDMTARRCTRA